MELFCRPLWLLSSTWDVPYGILLSCFTTSPVDPDCLNSVRIWLDLARGWWTFSNFNHLEIICEAMNKQSVPYLKGNHYHPATPFIAWEAWSYSQLAGNGRKVVYELESHWNISWKSAIAPSTGEQVGLDNLRGLCHSNKPWFSS